MTLTLRTRKALATTASLAAAVAVLGACSSHHAAIAGSSSIANPSTSSSVSLPAPTSSAVTRPSTAAKPPTSSAPTIAPVVALPKINPVVQQGKPPSPDLPLGQTGTRDQVPWGNVGTGWRLVQPAVNYGPTADLYLYDPEGGRYLISTVIPSQAWLRGWSPDGRRAVVVGINAQQIDLHTGQIVSGFSAKNLEFVSYTKPNGYALLFQDTTDVNHQRLVRIDPDGHVQQRYPAVVGGIGDLNSFNALYLSDGTGFIVGAGAQSVLMGNNAQPVRAFPLPNGYTVCRPLSLWTTATLLESCGIPNDINREALFTQPIAGGSPSVLTAGSGRYDMGYGYAWRLSNGDVLLANVSGCGSGGFDILHPNGQTNPLRMPVGVPAPGTIIGTSGDLVTFQVSARPTCGYAPQWHLVDYNMVTGRTVTILQSSGSVIGYPNT